MGLELYCHRVWMLVIKNMSMENNLINMKGASKAFIALIDAVSRGIGVLYEPTHIKRVAKADAEAMLIRAEAEKKKETILAASEQQVGENVPNEELNAIVSRIVGKEIRRQENIDAMFQLALDDLNKAKAIPSTKADSDWLTRFFNIVQDISDDELRRAWGKILSQEIQTPGSYSLRTLTTISNLSKKEAELFTKIGNYIFESNTCGFLIRSHTDILGEVVSYEDISLLMECGLIKETHDLNISYLSDQTSIGEYAFVYQDLAIIIEKKGDFRVDVPIYELTTAGSEIYKILSVKKDMSYLQLAAKAIKRDHVRIGYAKINKVMEDVIDHDDNVTYL